MSRTSLMVVILPRPFSRDYSHAAPVLSHSTVKHHVANARSKVAAEATAQLVWSPGHTAAGARGWSSSGRGCRTGGRLRGRRAATRRGRRGQASRGRRRGEGRRSGRWAAAREVDPAEEPGRGRQPRLELFGVAAHACSTIVWPPTSVTINREGGGAVSTAPLSSGRRLRRPCGSGRSSRTCSGSDRVSAATAGRPSKVVRSR